MTLTKKLVVLAIFVDLPLLYFWPVAGWSIDFSNLNPLVAWIIFLAPLLALPFLILGYALKEGLWAKGLRWVGLGIFLTCLAVLVGRWNYVLYDQYKLYPNVQASDVQSVEMYVGSFAEDNIELVTLNEWETERVLELWPETDSNNPHVDFSKIRQELVPEGENYFNFLVVLEDGSNINLGVWPPYYVDSHEIAYMTNNEEKCQQLADFYGELKEKYGPSNSELAAK